MSLGNKRKILLVEDEVILAMAQKMALEEYGYQVLTVNTGEKAVELVEKTLDIDLILMDIDLGKGIDGPQAAEIILKNRDLPLVFVSSHTEPEIVEKTEKITSYGYVVKSSTITVLDASIKMAFKLFDAKISKRKHEDALRESEQKFSDMVINSPGVVYQFKVAKDGTLGFTYISPKASDLFGLVTDPAALEWNPQRDLHPDDVQPFLTVVGQSIMERTPHNFEGRFLTPKGTVWFQASARPSVVDDILVFNGIMSDITARKLAEEELRESEESLSITLQSIGDAVIATDGRGKVTRMNPVAESLTGWQLADAKGKEIGEVFVIVNAQTREPVANPAKRVMETGAIVGLANHTVLISKTGAEYQIADSGAPIRDKAGKIVGVVLVFRDVSEEYRIQGALQDSEARFHSFFDCAPVGLNVFDTEGKVIAANSVARQYFGIAEDDPLSDYRFFEDPSIADETKLKIKNGQIATEERFIDFHTINQTHMYDSSKTEGERIFIKLTYAPYGTEIGKPLGIIATIQDFTANKLAAEKIQTERQLLFSVLDKVPAFVYLQNADYTIAYSNKTFDEKFTVPGKRFCYQVVAGRETPCENCPTFEVFQTRKPRQWNWKDPDGRSYIIFDELFVDSDGSEKILEFGLDISDQKKAENDLMRQNGLFTSLLENLPIGVFMVEAPSGKPLLANEVAVRLLGRGILPDVSKDNLSEVYNSLKAGTNERYPLEEMPIFKGMGGFTSHIDDMVVERPDGTRSLLEVFGSPVRDEHGSVWASLVSFLDISERKKAEDALRESEATFKTQLDNSFDVIFALDREGCFLFISPAWERHFGFSVNEALGKPFVPFVHPDDIVPLTEYLGRVMTAGRSETSPIFRVRRADGDFALFEANGARHVDTKGNLQFFGVGHDISERIKSEEKIKALLAEKELILKEVHHRIKNNMSTMKSLLKIQAGSMADSACVQVLKDAEGRMHSMELLYDKIYQSPLYLELPIGAYLSPLIDSILANFPNRTILTVEKKIDDFILNANQLQALGIIVNELLTNIMKYAFEGRPVGSITVSASLKAGRVSAVVQDDGIGLPVSVTSGSSKGFGLQLVRALMETLEGTVRIERGNGTRVVLEFIA